MTVILEETQGKQESITNSQTCPLRSRIVSKIGKKFSVPFRMLHFPGALLLYCFDVHFSL